MNPRTKILVFGIAGLAGLTLIGYAPVTRLMLYHRAVPNKATFAKLSKVPVALDLTDAASGATRKCDIGYASFQIPSESPPKITLLKSGPALSVTADHTQFYFLDPHAPQPIVPLIGAYLEHLDEIVGQKVPTFMKAPQLTYTDSDLAGQYSVPLSQWRIATMRNPEFAPYLICLILKNTTWHDAQRYVFRTDNLRGLLTIGRDESKGLFAHAAIESRSQNWTVGFFIYDIGTNREQVLRFASCVLAKFRFTDKPFPSDPAVLREMVTNAVQQASLE